jgi:predicted GH43/DUF377 family glycosyl hydrolase
VELTFAPDSDITERVIFPITEAQVNGLEDARFVAFEEAGSTTYYATYTAYDGREIRSEMLETRDFLSFRLVALRGLAASNKGMALFPRKIGGRYAMIARHDNESLYLVYSDNLQEWSLGTPVLHPEFPGNSSKSAIAARPSNWMKAGCCSPMVWGRCVTIRSGLCCWTSKTPAA